MVTTRRILSIHYNVYLLLFGTIFFFIDTQYNKSVGITLGYERENDEYLKLTLFLTYT